MVAYKYGGLYFHDDMTCGRQKLCISCTLRSETALTRKMDRWLSETSAVLPFGIPADAFSWAFVSVMPLPVPPPHYMAWDMSGNFFYKNNGMGFTFRPPNKCGIPL